MPSIIDVSQVYRPWLHPWRPEPPVTQKARVTTGHEGCPHFMRLLMQAIICHRLFRASPLESCDIFGNIMFNDEHTRHLTHE